MVSSHTLAEREGITSAQVRKDLSCFGHFGRRGLGYNVAHLTEQVRGILGLDHRWRVCIVGAGNIGLALAAYRGFADHGFDVVALYDRDPAIVGHDVEGHRVRDIARLATDEPCDFAVLATPVDAAQEVADTLVAAGVRGILNFAPRTLRVPPHVTVRTVDMTVEFESLSFALAQTTPPRRRRDRE